MRQSNQGHRAQPGNARSLLQRNQRWTRHSCWRNIWNHRCPGRLGRSRRDCSGMFQPSKRKINLLFQTYIADQAFHWCPDYSRASTEFARILKPDGVVAFIWNLEDRYVFLFSRRIFRRLYRRWVREGARWVAQLRDRIERHENGTPQFRLNLWRKTFETPSYQKAFQPPQEKAWSYSLPATLDIVVNRACSKSYIAILPEDEKANVKDDIKTIVEKGDDKVWLDESQSIFEYPYKCFVVIADKR